MRLYVQWDIISLRETDPPVKKGMTVRMNTNKYAERFSDALKQNGIGELIDSADRVIVGYSGGADSGFLLYLLREYARPRGIAVEAAHVNHMIRGAEADRDE